VAGVRIDPSYAQFLPKLAGPAGGAVISTQPGSSHFQFIGVEIKPSPGTSLYTLVELGAGTETSLSQLPSDFVFDRCYLHGDPTRGTRRGIAMNAPNITVMNSYLSDFKEVTADSQALACWNGPGPISIVNNYLEGAGENLMFGGQDPTIGNLVPTGITIRRNYFRKPLSWRVGDPSYQGTHWMVKNLLELKNATQVVIDGNVFENSWADAQKGFAIVFTPRNQDGTAPASDVSNVQFTNNTVRHAASGVNILGWDDIYTSQQLRNVTIANNVFEDVSTSYGGTGRLFQILNGAQSVTIDHNTGIQTGAIMMADQLPSLGLVFTNNLVMNGGGGFSGTGTAPGTGTLNQWFPGAVFLANGIVGASSSAYPAGNFFPPTLNDVGFVDAANHDYRLSSTSSLQNAGTDGKDVGVDMTALNAAQGAGSSPPPPPSPPAAPPAPTLTAATASSPTQINLAWTNPAGSNATANLVLRCSGSNCTPTSQVASLGATATVYQDNSVAASTAYSYLIQAAGPGGSTNSTTLSVTTPASGSPPPPTGTAPAVPQLSVSSARKNAISLSWTQNTSTAPVTSFDVLRCTGSGCTPSAVVASGLGATVRSYTNAGLMRRTTYRYMLRATNSNGSTSSNIASGTTN
jgi:hypothetical protein